MFPFRNQISKRFAKFSIYLQDNKNKEIEFNFGEKN